MKLNRAPWGAAFTPRPAGRRAVLLPWALSPCQKPPGRTRSRKPPVFPPCLWHPGDVPLVPGGGSFQGPAHGPRHLGLEVPLKRGPVHGARRGVAEPMVPLPRPRALLAPLCLLWGGVGAAAGAAPPLLQQHWETVKKPRMPPVPLPFPSCSLSLLAAGGELGPRSPCPASPCPQHPHRCGSCPCVTPPR